ncbi:MAG: hypothetical protein F6K48_26190 [Okeania sp. SIO3H1]|uniref:hypothetical protein n=1 Tax=Okeania sp. SIO1I7 TaxID=2607772 RepID=UPI0013CBCD40|nr:hypothetical protein [Okeania sp. SIO1I7]NEN92202.1 hypothetical protein [Okeania sp. SIO3H1]NET30287.1 hypothetical protein [Okeania sp. SIO1I7]
MTAIEAAIVASMDLGKLVLPEAIEAVYGYGDDVAILTPDAIITLPIQTFHNYLTDWLDALIEV